MFNAPLSLERADYLISLFELPLSADVVDIGCGNGAFLQRFAQTHVVSGVGVDTNADLIKTANTAWAKVESDSQLDFVTSDVNDRVKDMIPVDVMICIGAEYALGGYRQLLEVAKPLLKENGKLLVGTIYWKQPPSIDYLALMNGQNNHFSLHETVEIAYQAGYLPLDVGRSNNDEWDRFESRSNRRRYQDVSEWDSRWQWQQGYLKWGMDTMGFCYLLLQNS